MNRKAGMEDDREYLEEKQKLQEIINIVNNEPVLYYYGAGLRSEEFLQMQKEGYPFIRRPDAFVTTNKTSGSGHTQELDGIPIFTIDEINMSDNNACILVVAMDIYHEDISRKLVDIGCNNYYFITDAMEHIITRDFLRFYFSRYNLKAEFLPFVSTYMLDRSLYEDKVHTFSVMCEKDVILQSNVPVVPWVSNIQAGAYNATQIIAEYRDDIGDNISSLNPYYNELTGLYWIWKNTDYQYTGICHYRRRFESDIALVPLLDGGADIILPLPFVVGHNLYTYYQHWGNKEYYNEMLDVIKELYPEYHKTAKWCASHIVFIPNNICVARREIFERYCCFLFDVINAVESKMNKIDGVKQTRCWLSEHVSTIFFMKHLSDYRIAFSNLKRFW